MWYSISYANALIMDHSRPFHRFQLFFGINNRCVSLNAQKKDDDTEYGPPLKKKKKRKVQPKVSPSVVALDDTNALNSAAVSIKEANEITIKQEGAKRTARKQTKKPAGSPDPPFWITYSDVVTIQQHPTTLLPSSVRFTIRGNPRPLVRHRTTYGHMYNPSAPSQACFRKLVEQIIYEDEDMDEDDYDNYNSNSNRMDGVTTNGTFMRPFFHANDHLVMSIIFRRKRPKNHFVSGKPGPGRMRSDAPKEISPISSDIDNLAKFVLDAMNGLLYDDDKQIVSLHVTKLLDNEDPWEGSTEVYVRSIAEGDMDDGLVHAFRGP